MKYILSLAFFITLLNIGCKKAQDTLPSETHTGAYTMGFTANGTNYIANGSMSDLIGIGSVSYNMESSGNNILIDGRRDAGDNKFEIWLDIEYKDTLGTYLLKSGTFFLGGQPATESNTFNITNIHTGSLSVSFFDGRFTPFNQGTILSGTFEMDAVNNNGTVIHIINGRFDSGNK